MTFLNLYIDSFITIIAIFAIIVVNAGVVVVVIFFVVFVVIVGVVVVVVIGFFVIVTAALIDMFVFICCISSTTNNSFPYLRNYCKYTIQNVKCHMCLWQFCNTKLISKYASYWILIHHQTSSALIV